MSGHAYFGVNKEKIRHISLYKNGEYEKIRNVYLYKNGVYQRVWTGASIVTYYDGENVMGVEDVDEGADALHPAFSTTKQGYTLYGWKLAPTDKSRVEQKLGTGEPFSLYAYYVPNTIVIASGTLTNSMGWCSYALGVWNANYINGSAYAVAGRAGYIAGGGSVEANASFYIGLNEYQKASIGYRCMGGNGDNHSWKFDGNNRDEGNYTALVTKSGSHSMYTRGTTGNDSWTSSLIGITNITLSNPEAWA